MSRNSWEVFLLSVVGLVIGAGCGEGKTPILAADGVERGEQLDAVEGGGVGGLSEATPEWGDEGTSDLFEWDIGDWECDRDGDCPDPGELGPCRVYVCSEEHVCVVKEAPDGEGCVPEDPCFSSGVCVAGKCVGDVPVVCDDGNVCTLDTCESGVGCIYSPVEGECDDHDLCTQEDACYDGECTGLPVECDDSNPCTTDSCDPDVGCLFTDAEGPCDDGDPCTTEDICLAGACVGQQDICECREDVDCAWLQEDDKCVLEVSCDKGGVPYVCKVNSVVECPESESYCSKVVCDPSTGMCVTTPDNEGAECEEPENCVVSGVCSGGVCIGEAPDCDDGNVCTLDQCIPGLGCLSEPQYVACDDSDPCTVNDFCTENGVCVGTDFSCGEVPPLGFRLTSLIFKKPGFCIPTGQGDCKDATQLVNTLVEADINNPDNPLVMLGVFDPFDLDTDTSFFYIGPGNCSMDGESPCTFTGAPSAMGPVKYDKFNECGPVGQSSSPPPCFVISGDSLIVGVLNIALPVYLATITGTLTGLPKSDGIESGHIVAFLRKATADKVKVTLPLMPQYHLSELLSPDDVTTEDGQEGWKVEMDYTAVAVDVALK